ncbi:hypothetical protein PLESTB_001622100 [Pleodorina starrii]|uniref:Uncharacterized protein n=1 Tax=Pleodorina starrii TaxID=330485 RepID=A0A9W6BYH0_9CHLO|nr:hypothetical protein PLESTM_002041600 [Pleodorina starrii]GLC60514.1 hypothetical protein PLESTB_001622100 [Pleodorina starrii]GLC76620.1 hypothetical protein PLESTF_001806600 [Pleodorina starrii]
MGCKQQKMQMQPADTAAAAELRRWVVGVGDSQAPGSGSGSGSSVAGCCLDGREDGSETGPGSRGGAAEVGGRADALAFAFARVCQRGIKREKEAVAVAAGRDAQRGRDGAAVSGGSAARPCSHRPVPFPSPALLGALP